MKGFVHDHLASNDDDVNLYPPFSNHLYRKPKHIYQKEQPKFNSLLYIAFTDPAPFRKTLDLSRSINYRAVEFLQSISFVCELEKCQTYYNI